MAQTKPKAGQFYGVSNNGTDGEFLQTDGAGGMAWASPITNPTITSIDYPGTQTAADPAGGESVIINGTLFASGITCTVGGTSAVTAFNSATQITITTPAKAAGPYTVAVLNPDGGTASQASFIQYSGVPVWSTAAGTLGNVMEGTSASFQVTATEGSDTIEYAVTTGTLPTGLSLATATGAITGTAPAVSADTTTTFSITATDDENQTSASRSFSITVQNDVPSNHFNTVLYTGTGSTNPITTVGFPPDFTWVKSRNNSRSHALVDSVRGGNGSAMQILDSATTASQFLGTNYFNSLDSAGFTVSGNDTYTNNGNFVAWNFKAGGAAVTNNVGDISSQVSANNTLGFSIVSWTSSPTASDTIGSGLDERVEFLITKKYSGSRDWIVWHKDLPNNGYLSLNGTSGESTPNDNRATVTNDTTFIAESVSGDLMIAYCFASKPGFSKVGSYTGNGSASGPMVQTGFEPAFIMIKSTSSSGTAWNMWDNKRTPYDMLRANASDAEYAGPGRIQFFANGFQLLDADASRNSSGGNYIYLAFAADGSTTTPSLANSFSPTTYAGTGGTQSITTGFKPDLLWIGNRTSVYTNLVFDSIRGADITLNTSNTNGNYNGGGNAYMSSFDSNGFSLPSSGNAYTNASGSNYVAWAWKAGGAPSINTDGTTTSIVSANQAAGFSVVEYTGPSALNPGHGLGVTPELIIVKGTSATSDWMVYNSFNGTGGYLSFTRNDQGGGTGTDAWQANANQFSTVNATSFTTSDTGASVTYIAYCFKSITGYSKVGTYSGTGAAQTITTGFQPGFLMVKATSHTSSWYIVDSARTPNYFLSPNSSAAEYTDSGKITFTSNGFTLGSTSYNNSGYTWIYLAIKEN